MYPAKNKDVTFVMEDGKEIDEKAESFEVSARIVIKKSSLSKIITILKNPPVDTDYSEDILLAIKNGHNTKKRIIQELEMDEYTYNRFTQSLRMNRLIKYEHNQWHRVEEL